MVATSGARLISEEAVDTLKTELFPLADVLTPNIPEAEVLTGINDQNRSGHDRCGKRRFPKRITVQSSVRADINVNDANDLLYARRCIPLVQR